VEREFVFGQVEQNGEALEAISMGGGVAQVMLQGGGEAQVLQVLSLKDATVLTKAMVCTISHLLTSESTLLSWLRVINMEV
jgi:hypothetical protein